MRISDWSSDVCSSDLGFDLRLIAPIGAWIADAIKIADWNMNPDPVVLAAGFEQQHQHVGICRQAIGEYAAGAAATDDDVVEAAEIFNARLSNEIGRTSCRERGGRSV